MHRLERRIETLERLQGQPDKIIDISGFQISEREFVAIIREGNFQSAQDVINHKDCTP